jgi:signal transduction histidine kinase
MNSLDLLETHRKKVALAVAGVVMILLYCSVIIFELVLIYLGKSRWNDMGIVVMILVFLFPLLYSILAYIGCRIMHRIYRPIRENMTNLENFTVNVNHEFKTSLSEIISSLQLGIEIQDEKNYAPQALRSAQKLNIVLDSLTPLIKMSNTNYRKKKTDIIKVFDEVIKESGSQLEEKNMHIITEYPKTSLYRTIDS